VRRILNKLVQGEDFTAHGNEIARVLASIPRKPDIWKSRQTKERKLSLLLAGSCSPEKRKYLTFDALKKKSQKSNR